MAQFDEITKDVGQELKNTARRIYMRTFWCWLIITILETIATIAGVASSDGDLVGLLLLLPFAILIEYWIVMGIAHLITINLYAKGEVVHYLRAISQQGLSRNENAAVDAVKPMKETGVKSAQQTVVKSVQETTIEPAQETVVKVVREVVVPTTVGWLCKNCGTQNKTVHGQCKKCGTYRSYETSEDVIEPQLRTELVEEEIAPPVSAEESKKREDGKTLAQKIAEKVFVQDENRPEVHLDDSWICSGCGTTNAMKYGQCKKCGKFKNS